MQNNPYPYPHQLLFFDPYSQTFLSCIILPPQAFMNNNSELQIQNLPNLETIYPIKNSDEFTVEVTEMNGKKKKYSLEELAKIVPTYLSEGVVSPEIKDDKLTIVTHKKLDESSSNKILIKTDSDSFVVIPNYLIEKAREKERELRIKEVEKEENKSFSNLRKWGKVESLDFIFKTNQNNGQSLYATVDSQENNPPSSSEPGGTIRRAKSDEEGPPRTVRVPRLETPSTLQI